MKTITGNGAPDGKEVPDGKGGPDDNGDEGSANVTIKKRDGTVIKKEAAAIPLR